MELLSRDTNFKAALDSSYLSKRRGVEANTISDCTNGQLTVDVLKVDYPKPHDVLLGKGRACQEYPGNQAMNRMIDDRAIEYRSADKDRKCRIAMDILARVESRGRFLDRIEAVGWTVVQDKVTLRNKITQAFRLRNRSSTDDTKPIEEAFDTVPWSKRSRHDC
jgi:hypothetical protein